MDPGHPPDAPRHDAAVVQQHQYPLVALRPVGPHHRLAHPCGGGPVDAAELVVGAVLAQLFELGTPTESACRARADLEDPRPADPQLGLPGRTERRVDAQLGPQRHLPLAGPEAQPAMDPQRHPVEHEVAATHRFERRGHVGHRVPGNHHPEASGTGTQRRCRTVGHLQHDSTRSARAHRPAQLRLPPGHHDRRVSPLYLEQARSGAHECIRGRHDEHQCGHHGRSQERVHRRARVGEEGQRAHRGNHGGPPRGQQGHLSAGRAPWPAPSRAGRPL